MTEIKDVLEEATEEGKELGEVLYEKIAETFSDMCDKIEELKREWLKKMVAFDICKYKPRKKRVPWGVGKSLIRSDQKLLGRRREQLYC